ncbi:hypothetical protein [Thermopirellula anaerolimosa]
MSGAMQILEPPAQLLSHQRKLVVALALVVAPALVVESWVVLKHLQLTLEAPQRCPRLTFKFTFTPAFALGFTS